MWTCTYAHERRQEAHRCRACWKIIQDGQPVIMARVGNRARSGQRLAWAIHEACADVRHSPTYSWREVFAAWESEAAKGGTVTYLRAG